MADVYLGLTASAIAPLPPFRWTGGGDPAFPTSIPKQVEDATMLDGSRRFNFKSKSPRTWSMSWEMLTDAEMTTFLALRAANSALYFQNNWEDATWRLVVITDFDINPFLKAGPSSCRWSLAMTLEEVR
jgi:hypothetical protein